jgi:hypothetical protein
VPMSRATLYTSHNSPKYDLKYYSKGEGNSKINNSIGIIPLIISTNISLKRDRG